MKPKFKRWAMALCLVLALIGQASFAQGPPVVCTPSDPNILVPTQFSNWNWEFTLTQQGYCSAWMANIIGAPSPKTFMRAPWAAANSDAIMRIGTTGDYQRIKGWELVRMDFGGNLGAVSSPYFVLYNKYSSTLRVFMYLYNQQAYSQVIMTLRHAVGNGRSSAALGLANQLQKAPDKYRSQVGTSGDLITYVCKYGASTGWVMGEFTTLFDPYSADQGLFESALQFDVFGVTNTTLRLEGSIQFTTIPDDGYGFSGPAGQVETTSNGLKTFSGQAAKYLGKIGDISTKIDELNKKADKAANSLKAYDSPSKQPLYAAYKLSGFVRQKTEGKAANAIKGVADFAGSLGGVFSLIGTVVGALWPDTDKVNETVRVAPTISSGTIRLNGTMETSSRISGFSVQVPGTPHNIPGTAGYNANTHDFARTYQPFYDCPMGLFNLATTPTFDAIYFIKSTDFPRQSSGLPGDNPPTIVAALSYRPRPLQPVFNRAAGIEVVSVKASIMQKVPFAALNDVFNPAYYYDNNYQASRCFNFMRAQVLTGALEVDPYDSGDPALSTPTDDFFLVHTPFVDASCFPQMAFNSYAADLANSPAFVRIVATMRRVGAAPTDAPIYFVQDYVPDIVSIPNPANSSQRIDQRAINGPTPFGIYQAPRPAYNVATIDNGIVNITTATSTTVFQFNTLYDAPVDLNFTNTSQTTLFPPGIQYGARMTAGNSISVEGELSVLPGNELDMEVSRTAFIRCPSQPATGLNSSNCIPNAYALRPTNTTTTSSTAQALSAESGFSLTPNPATGSTNAVLRGSSGEYLAQVEVLNLNGQRIWFATSEPQAHEHKVSIPLVGIQPGLYIVRLRSTARTYAQKLQVE